MPSSKKAKARQNDHRSQQNSLSHQHAGEADRKTSIETGGQLFADGRTIELIKEAESEDIRLLVSEGAQHAVEPSIEIDGRVYVPPRLTSSILRGVTLPENAAAYESTKKLFMAVQSCFTNSGIPEGFALASTYFVFATWFTDSLAAAPCLVIAGPRPEASLLLRILGCLVRHPMSLIGINARCLTSIPMVLQPTLLIDNDVGPSMMKLLIASNSRDAHLPSGSGMANVYCGKAIYRGHSADEMFLRDGVLQINLSPSRAKLPLLSVRAEMAIKKEFQPRLLMYRVANMVKVRDSEFDCPEFVSGLRVLARILGAPIVDAPSIQAAISNMLRAQEERHRMGRWLDAKCIAIEALLSHSHDKSQHRVYVGEVATRATVIMHARGEDMEFTPKMLGNMMRTSFGMFPERDEKGYAIEMTERLRNKIHALARDFDVAALEEPLESCSICSEIILSGNVSN